MEFVVVSEHSMCIIKEEMGAKKEMSVFGDRLRKMRNESKKTQNEVARGIGISKSSINMYERGEREPGLELLETIADYFEVSVEYLLGRTEEMRGLRVPGALHGVEVAFNRGEFEDLTQYEVERLAEFARFLKTQRNEGGRNDET